jgi:hypothetical protein
MLCSAALPRVFSQTRAITGAWYRSLGQRSLVLAAAERGVAQQAAA